MSASDRAIRSLCVVGAGMVGLSAALAFARALPGLRITVIETPPDPSALADRNIACLPTIHRFHAAIGLDELGLIREGIAFHHLGSRFENWSASGAPWFHVFGDYGLPADSVPFHQLWTQLRRANLAEPYDHYAAAARLAEAGKFVHPEEDDRSPLSTYLYGLRLDPEMYRAKLLKEVEKHRLEIVRGELVGIERREDKGIASLRLRDEGVIEADLFLDCAGPSAPLRSALDEDFDDWADCLPCDRIAFGRSQAAHSLLPYDNKYAATNGWNWASTFPGGEALGAAWSSRSSDEAELLQALDADSVVTIRPGRRVEPWKHNVLAIGDSAVATDPLVSTQLHLAHSFILRALELIPGRDCHPLELTEFNRRAADETARVRDFLALHYLRSGRSEGEFWRAAAKGRIPDSLAHTLDQFETRGRLPFYEEETFDQESWLAALIGLGVMPRHVDPVSDRIDGDRAASSMAQLGFRLEKLPARLPDYSDYLKRMGGRDFT